MRTSAPKTEQIFRLTAPYNNPYQGKGPFLLFVCSAGILRSPTAAAMAVKLGYNARSCGAYQYALIRLSVNLIEWADKIIFIGKENYNRAMLDFEAVEYDSDIKDKAIIWDIPDEYDYMHPELVNAIQQKIGTGFQ